MNAFDEHFVENSPALTYSIPRAFPNSLMVYGLEAVDRCFVALQGGEAQFRHQARSYAVTFSQLGNKRPVVG